MLRGRQRFARRLFSGVGRGCRARSAGAQPSASGVDADCPANGFVEAGTTCTDDGEPCTLDACDGNGTCTHTALPDSDGDGVCDAQDDCTNIGGGQDFVTKPKSKAILSKVNTDTTPGNGKLVLGGTFALPAGRAFGDLDPQLRGARIVVRTMAVDDVLDVTLPGGAYAGNGTHGWKTNAKGSVWQYLDKTGSPLSGITGLKATDRSKGCPAGSWR